MGKSFIVVLVLTVFPALFSCAGEKYSDVKKFIEETTEAYEECTTALDRAQNAEDVAKAFNDLADRIQDFGPKTEKIEKKYPDLLKDPPAELRKLLANMRAAMNKFGKKMEKVAISQFKDDPQIETAVKRWVLAAGLLGPSLFGSSNSN